MTPKPITRNTLFYGDNLNILQDHIPSESVDLIYLDPPFNSNRSYNVLFKNESGLSAESQIHAFDDTWHWGKNAEDTYDALVRGDNSAVAQMIGATRQFIGTNQMMAYLVMMAARLVELHRVLKPTGSLYLHCDPTASHYLKVVLDTIFGVSNFRNEVIWKRTFGHGSPNRWGSIHDTLLFYTKTDTFCWNKVLQDFEEEYLISKYRFTDERGRYRLVVLTAPGTSNGDSGKPWKGYDPTKIGRHWAVPQKPILEIVGEESKNELTLNEQLDILEMNGFIKWTQPSDGKLGTPEYKLYLPAGMPIQDIVEDIPPVNSQAAERLGYPTQKPLELLERIIQASSNSGDVVLDPFSGCGTAISAAHRLGRRWIGIDVTHLAIGMHKNRLKEHFGLIPKRDYDVIGEPTDLAGALQLSLDDRYQFQWWALGLINARAEGASGDSKVGKKGSDKGIDGTITFMDDASKKVKRVIISVKSGNVNSGMVRDLRGVIERENESPIGLFITLLEPTSEMKKEAITAGSYLSPLWQKKYPRLQILTIQDLLNGAKPDIPPDYKTFKQAERISTETSSQPELKLE